MVFIISILVFELLSTTLSSYIIHLKAFTSPYKATFIGMLTVVFVLFPAYKWMDEAVQALVKKSLLAGKNIGGRTTGIVLVFLACFFGLYLIYLHMWYEIPYQVALKKTALFLIGLFS